ncbi:MULTISPECIES: HAD family hydrolase [Alteromonas]|uniref:HAD family hydrolase n=1 Tax=Alteromonas TaxID=226 RepID=UPI00035547AB|nr:MULTISPECIES: HAD family phosphatase [Alteromonas]MBR9897551.1 HAD family phosphatase [Gammaproteobacteria bacterium]MDY6882503.1 HAD family phosphatase [Pseudomonadota bacterium]AGP80608.1 enzymatic protein [Alteromonas mediterranea MED64]NQY16446.1 HAD family phosphatase [Alteromonas sp.]QGX60678.1 HAD-IA family hydrolase [Alteromonas mediterranea]
MTLHFASSTSGQLAVSEKTTTLLFDHDGTLIDSETVHYDLWKAILLGYHVDLSEAFYCEVMAGIPVKQNAIDLVAHFKLDVAPEVLAEQKHKSISDYLDKHAFPLMPYAKEAIKTCFDKGYRIGIVTGGSKKSVEKTLSQYALANYISCVVAVEDVVTSKPAPDCYELAMRQLNKTPEECVAIEDTQTGMRAALAANLACVVIPTPLSQHHDLSRATVRYGNLQTWVESELNSQ